MHFQNISFLKEGAELILQTKYVYSLTGQRSSFCKNARFEEITPQKFREEMVELQKIIGCCWSNIYAAVLQRRCTNYVINLTAAKKNECHRHECEEQQNVSNQHKSCHYTHFLKNTNVFRAANAQNVFENVRFSTTNPKQQQQL